MQNVVLIEFREKLNLSLQEMADKIGVSKSYYEKIEYGDRTPSFNFISKFKLAFPKENIEDFFLKTNYTKCVNSKN